MSNPFHWKLYHAAIWLLNLGLVIRLPEPMFIYMPAYLELLVQVAAGGPSRLAMNECGIVSRSHQDTRGARGLGKVVGLDARQG